MTTGADVMTEARGWVNEPTPYEHQAMRRGLGADCVGLIIGVGLACGVTDWTPKRHRPFAGYARTPNPDRMRVALAEFLIPITEPQIGDIMWLEWREGLPMHLAILADFKGRETMIHASGEIGWCVEHDIDAQWRERIAAWWRYPGLG